MATARRGCPATTGLRSARSTKATHPSTSTRLLCWPHLDVVTRRHARGTPACSDRQRRRAVGSVPAPAAPGEQCGRGSNNGPGSTRRDGTRSVTTISRTPPISSRPTQCSTNWAHAFTLPSAPNEIGSLSKRWQREGSPGIPRVSIRVASVVTTGSCSGRTIHGCSAPATIRWSCTPSASRSTCSSMPDGSLPDSGLEGWRVGSHHPDFVACGVARVSWTPDSGGDPRGGRPEWVVQRSTPPSSVVRPSRW